MGSPIEAQGGHTRGPWSTNCSHIYAPDGAIIAQVHNPGSRESDYPLVANRDLMAADPDLLAALIAHQAHSDLCLAASRACPDGETIPKSIMDELNQSGARVERARRAAIAKATGQ